MPREFGSDSDHEGPLVFTGVVECEGCGKEFEAVWTDPSVDVEQLVDPPVAELVCPACGFSAEYEYTGYWNYSDPG
jgi:hypothetical protein